MSRISAVAGALAWLGVAAAPLGAVAAGGPPSYTLNAITAVSADDVWAFGTTVDLTQTVFLHWDGRSWRFVPHPALHGMQPHVHSATAISASDIWAVGDVAPPNGHNQQIPFALHWDGTGWRGVPVPFAMHHNFRGNTGSLGQVVANASNDVWAYGSYDTVSYRGAALLHWDGSAWSEIALPASPVGQDDIVFQIAANGPQSIKAFGEIAFQNDGDVPLVEQYANGAWTTLSSLVLPGPDVAAYLEYGAQVAPGDSWALGYMRVKANGRRVIIGGFTENWVDTSGQVRNLYKDGIFGTQTNPTLYGVAGSGANDVWAYGHADDGVIVTHYDGRHWSPATVLLPPESLASIEGMAVVGPNDAWAIGQVFSGSNSGTSVIAHWDGTAWTSSRSP